MSLIFLSNFKKQQTKNTHRFFNNMSVFKSLPSFILTFILTFSSIFSFSLLSQAYKPDEAKFTENTLPKAYENVGIDEQLGKFLNSNYSFLDETGKNVKLFDFFKADKPVILSMAYFTCPSLCNFHMNGVMQALQELKLKPGRDFHYVVVSIEPKDTFEIAQKKKETYLSEFELNDYKDGIHFLTAQADNEKKLSKEVGFKYKWDEKTNQWSHAAAAIFISPTKKISRYLHGVAFDRKNFKLALLEAAEGKVGTIVDQFVLYCFNYKPEENKYALAAFNVMRLGGALTLVIVFAWVFSFWMKIRRKKKLRS